MTTENWINLAFLIVAIISMLIAGGSLWFTYSQWKKVRMKIGMISDFGKASEVLPAWYTKRMMTDDWMFGLLTSDGRTIVVTRINGLSDDGKWMDVELVTEDLLPTKEKSNYVFAVAEDRTKASVQVSSVVVAMELRTS